MTDGRTQSHLLPRECEERASERPRRGHGPMDARFPSSRASLSPSPSSARSLDRRFGPVSRRRLPNEPKSGRGRISSLARVGPGCPATPGPSQPPRRDGAWPQHEVIIGAADGQNNSSVLTCLKNRNAGMLLVVMVVARRVRTLSLSSSLNN